MKLSYKYINLLMAVIVLLLGAACISDDNLNELLPTDNGEKIYFSLQAPDPVEVTVTRSTTDMEKTIRTARLMIFDKEGTCFYNKALDENVNTDYTNRILAVPVQADEDRFTDCTVWFVANIALWNQIAQDSDLDLSNIKTLSDLQNKFGHMQVPTSNPTYREWIPMAGNIEHVNMTQAGSLGSPQTLPLTRILAKVNFQINVEGNFSFYFNNWYLENIPSYSYLIPNTDNKDYCDINPDKEGLFYPEPGFTNNYTTQTVKQWFGNGTTSTQTSTYSFYTYENRRGGRGEINWENMSGEAGDYAGLDGNVSDLTGNNPKYKTLYAPANATFLVITGMIRQRSGDTGEIQDTQSFAYRIALGANNTNDYNLTRNSEYTYNIHIKGTTYDDVTVDVFDSRVHKAYALLIDAPSLDRIDSHYDKRHIDISSSRGELKLQLFADQPAAEDGNNPLTIADCPFILSIEETYDYELVQQKRTEITLSPNDDEEEMNRHIFLYAKENLTTKANTAVLKITHSPEQGSSEVVTEPEYRFYTISQAGLIPIDVEINGQTVHLGVESYEECDMRLDPRINDENPGLNGLQWGWSGTDVFSPRYVWEEQEEYLTTSTTDGIGNTKRIIKYEREIYASDEITAFEGVDVNSIYNNYAARYCYNKNGRDEDGTVNDENIKWYLPSIDELKILTASITEKSASWNPTSMEGNNYWSSSVPTFSETTTNPWNIRENPILYVLWNLFIGSNAQNSDFEFYVTKVAKAAINGQEQMEEAGEENGNRVHAYNKRTGKKHVRAVRIMP